MSELERFEAWWNVYAAKLFTAPSPTWREIAWAAWQAAKES